MSVIIKGDGTVSTGLNANQVNSSGVFHGRVSSNAASNTLPSGWSVVRNAQGDYTITHNLGDSGYTVVATSRNTFYFCAQNTTTIADPANDFGIYVRDTSDALQDGDFSFILMTD